jgi:hypothetical protein
MVVDREYIDAIARSLYQAYIKDTTGVGGRWSDLSRDGKATWRNMVKRALRRIAELDAQKQAVDPGRAI